MTKRLFALLVFAIVVALSQAASIGAQPPPRLIADNRTPYVADVYAWNGNGWNFVSRLNPRMWQAFPNAAQGSLWRAVIGQTVREHRVHYVWDQGYGGHQSVWWIQ